MKKPLVIIIALLFVCILCSCVSIFTLAGKVPVLSDLFWKQKDLEVEADTQLIYDVYDEIGFQNNLADKKLEEGVLVYSGELEVDRTFTSAEANAWVNSWEEQWIDMPFQNPQLIIHDDGSLEGSAILSLDTAIDFAKQLGYSQADIDKAINSLEFISNDIPIYVEANGQIINNEIELNLTNFEVAGFKVPAEATSGFEGILEDMYPQIRESVPTLDIKQLKSTEDGLHFEGRIPAEIDLE